MPLPNVLRNRVLALREGVPQLDRPVATARNDLPVVPRERHAVHVLSVALESAHRDTSVEIPEAHRFVPRLEALATSR